MTGQTAFDLTTTNNISHLILNRPDKLNSLIASFWTDLPTAIEKLVSAGQTRVLVISSTGRHFTAGMDLSVFASLDSDTGNTDRARANAAFVQLVEQLQETFTCLTRAPFPVIAAVQGGCIGAGLDLVSACDLRYASRDAFFTLHEINIAMVADVGTFPRLQQLVSPGIVREMAYTGEPVKAERAEMLGLVNGVLETHQELLDTVMQVADKIAAKSPLAIAGSKQIINYGSDHTTADTLSRIAIWQAGMMSMDDIKRAISAQQKKSGAEFSGLASRKRLKS